jgi:glycosyltransferase involved in cell wall biosynthesis
LIIGPRLSIARSLHGAVTANSEAIKVLRTAGFDRPARTIGYGVDTEAFANPNVEELKDLRERLKVAPDDRVIGFAGRIKWMKGLDLLIEAFTTLIQSGETKLKLLVIGTGEFEGELQAQIDRAGINEYVRRVPNVSQAEVPRYMQLMDTHVLPSRREGMWTEQFGRVLIEAMAARTVVIGSSSGAIPEVIGEAGFVFEENNAADLQAKLRSALYMTRIERSTLLDAGSKRAQDVYSWRAFAERSFAELSGAVDDVRAHSHAA